MSTIWQTFRGGPTKAYGNEAGATISAKGRISLSRGAMLLLGNPSHLLTHYDDRNGVIGITPADAGTPGAFEVKRRTIDASGYIQAQPFCRHFGIRVDSTERFDHPELDPNGILRLDLKATSRVGQWKGRPKSDSSSEGPKSQV